LLWYNSQFPPPVPGRVIGEASVDSLVGAGAPRMVKKMCGAEMKFFALLREPAERMHSNFLMRLRFLGRVKMAGGSWRPASRVSFHTWAVAEVEAYRRASRKLGMEGWERAPNALSLDTILFLPAENAVYESMYSLHLARWFSVFPRSHFQISFSDRFFRNPAETLRSAYDFLGVCRDCVDLDSITAVSYNSRQQNNRSGVAILPQHSMTPATREVLMRFFIPFNQHLEALLDEPLPTSWFSSQEAS